MAFSYTDLKKGVLFIKDGDPYEVIESSFTRMQQRKAVVQAKVRNLISGKIHDFGLQASDSFEEANVEKRPLRFLYQHRGDFVFSDPKDPRQRTTLQSDVVGEKQRWLKPNTDIIALFFRERLINFTIPIKVDLKVIEAPPGVQGDRAQSGTKVVTLETGIAIQAPLFINPGDVIRVNTETGEYVERAEKA